MRSGYDRRSKIVRAGARLLGLLGLVAPVGAVALAQQTDLALAGRKVYDDRKCATCHMVANEGNVRFKLDGVGGRLSAADLRRWLTDADTMERALPALPAIRMSEWLDGNRKISDVDIDALVAYLATLK